MSCLYRTCFLLFLVRILYGCLMIFFLILSAGQMLLDCLDCFGLLPYRYIFKFIYGIFHICSFLIVNLCFDFEEELLYDCNCSFEENLFIFWIYYKFRFWRGITTVNLCIWVSLSGFLHSSRRCSKRFPASYTLCKFVFVSLDTVIIVFFFGIFQGLVCVTVW